MNLKIILSHPEKKEIFEKMLTETIKTEVKNFLETLALAEREIFCEETKDVGNGFRTRTLDTPFGKIENLKVPRTRYENFFPFFLEPYKRSLFTLDELIIAMYQGGCSQRDIARTLTYLLEEKYSPSYVSRVVSVVEEKIKEFNERKIEKWYPFVYLDGSVLKIRRDVVEGEVVYIALGIDEEGYKEVIGFWIPGSDGESASLWKEFLYHLKERGLREPLLFIGDGLKGLKEAVKEVYPLADFQSCILHKVKGTLKRVRKRDREALAIDLKKIYRQNSKEGFIEAFKKVKEVWGKIYPLLFKGWEEDLESLTSYFKYPEEIRRSIYTTNVLERFIKEVKRRSKVVEVFPKPVSAEKVLYLVAIEMNESYKKRKVKGFDEIKEELVSIRRERYGEKLRKEAETQKQKILKFHTHNS